MRLELGLSNEREVATNILATESFGEEHSKSFSGDLAWPAEGPYGSGLSRLWGEVLF